MLIRVVNPNSTSSMTDLIGTCARAVVGPGTRIDAVNPVGGPVAIENAVDEARCVPGLLDLIAAGDADAYVLACFGDPGLEAAREITSSPVVGIAEAGMRTASYLTRRFTIVTTLQSTLDRAWELVARYGMAPYCAQVRTCDVAVLDLESNPAAYKAILEECHRAVEIDKAGAIVLGCAGMADLCRDLSTEVGVPVVDGVAAAVLQAQSLVTLRLSRS